MSHVFAPKYFAVLQLMVLLNRVNNEDYSHFQALDQPNAHVESFLDAQIRRLCKWEVGH
jgi:hypothetical protein